jgi:hypothetical protein
MKRLFRTGCAWSKDRGVLACGSSRMEFRDSFYKGMISSQETPDIRLEQRRMRHRTENSSITFFFKLALFVGASLGFDSSEKTFAFEASESPQDPYEVVALGYETMMLKNMFDQMRKSQSLFESDPHSAEGNPFAESNAERIMKSFQEQAMIESLAKSHPLGIGRSLVRSLKKQNGYGTEFEMSALAPQKSETR